jgi:hypothetical protein
VPCVQIIARQRFGALERQLRARFAGGQRKLLLLKAIKGAILAARQPQSGECRVKRANRLPVADDGSPPHIAAATVCRAFSAAAIGAKNMLL